MKRKVIASRHNALFKTLCSLRSGRGVKKYAMALLSGPKQVKETLDDFPDYCESVILTEDITFDERILPKGIRIYSLTNDLFREVDVYGTGQAILLVRFDSFPKWSVNENLNPGCSLLIPFQDPVNVGSAVRSAAAFGVSQVILLREAAHPFNYKSTRVAGSALFRVSFREGPSIEDLEFCGEPLITLSQKGKDIRQFEFQSTFGMIPGLEGPGMPHNLNKIESISIPMETGVESLNASLSIGIALFMWRFN